MRDWLKTEDWWAVWIGLLVFALSLGPLAGLDLLGWAITLQEWVDPGKALGPASKQYAGLPAWASLLLTYLFLLAVLSAGAASMGLDLRRFILGFTVIFWVSYFCLFLGNYAYIATTTPKKRAEFGIPWSVGLTGEAGYVLALLAGLVVGNFLPRAAGALKEGARAEWFVKAAIVILGGALGVKAALAQGLASVILVRGFAAIVEAYLIYWALVYWIARRFFRFSREWAAPLASGISVCGVSAAIATGAAIRARPVVPVMVSSLVVIFAVVELLVLPLAARTFLYREPMVAGAWMGLAVKTDGAAFASGTVSDALVCAQAEQQEGVTYKPGYMLMTTTTVKLFIDVFIGIWAFVLGLIWVYRIDRRPGEHVRPAEIWYRFPKFVLGYALTFLVLFFWSLLSPEKPDPLKLEPAAPFALAIKQSELFRGLFFVMTFFSIGLAAEFRKLWQEGIGRLAAVYVLSLFGFIIWIGLAISWVFFHGVRPPLAGD
jgi:uncharacterized membrane protein YadS